MTKSPTWTPKDRQDCEWHLRRFYSERMPQKDRNAYVELLESLRIPCAKVLAVLKELARTPPEFRRVIGELMNVDEEFKKRVEKSGGVQEAVEVQPTTEAPSQENQDAAREVSDSMAAQPA